MNKANETPLRALLRAADPWGRRRAAAMACYSGVWEDWLSYPLLDGNEGGAACNDTQRVCGVWCPWLWTAWARAGGGGGAQQWRV